MKINVVKNAQGKAIATFDVVDDPSKPSVKPILPQGHKIEVMDVADDFHSKVVEFFKQHG